jgi:hypothetical protein
MASCSSFFTAAALASCLETGGAFCRACRCDVCAIEEKEGQKKASKRRSFIQYFFIMRRDNRSQQNKSFCLAETTAGPRPQQQAFSTCLLACYESLTI